MKTAFAAALLSLCLSAQAFYILVDAGPAAWLEGNRVEQVSVELSNGDPAIPGELARSRQPFDAANIKAVDGQIVAMADQELDAREAARLEAEAQAEALRGPAPEVFVPMLDSDGETVGTARIVVIEGSLAVLASTNSASPQRTWAEQKDQILSQLDSVAESRASAAAARIAVKQTVLAGELPEEDLAQIVDLWPAWSAGVSYAVDEIVRHEGSLYKVVQAHTSQADWPPPDVPSLFAEITPPGLIAEWVQPTGAHDAYSLGDLVTHVGQVWESTADNNVWEPGVYGWEVSE